LGQKKFLSTRVVFVMVLRVSLNSSKRTLVNRAYNSWRQTLRYATLNTWRVM